MRLSQQSIYLSAVDPLLTVLLLSLGHHLPLLFSATQLPRRTLLSQCECCRLQGGAPRAHGEGVQRNRHSVAGQQNHPPVSPCVCLQPYLAHATAVSAWLLAQLLFLRVITGTSAVCKCVLAAAALSQTVSHMTPAEKLVSCSMSLAFAACLSIFWHCCCSLQSCKCVLTRHTAPRGMIPGGLTATQRMEAVQ